MRQWLVCITGFVTAALLLGLSGCERYALDRQMEELCKKDGGIKVYEKVTLPAQEYEALWKFVRTQADSSDYYGPDYRYAMSQKILVGKDANPGRGQGRLVRWHQQLYRSSDQRILGESVFYARGGGDFFTFGLQPSIKNCPVGMPDLAQSIFIKGE
jgi:hypothetical protein